MIETITVPQLLNKMSVFMESEDSLPYLPETVTGIYPKLDECSPY